MSDIEKVLVVNVVLGVDKVLPLGLGLHGRGMIAATVVGKEVGPLPVAVLPSALHGDDGIESDPAAVEAGRSRKGGWGDEIEAAKEAVGMVSAAGGEGEDDS